MTDKRQQKHITEANQILVLLGLPRAQQNERSALCSDLVNGIFQGRRKILYS